MEMKVKIMNDTLALAPCTMSIRKRPPRLHKTHNKITGARRESAFRTLQFYVYSLGKIILSYRS